ncbi:MAG: GerMN domain-containing protein [Acidobacteriota bacterium]
MNRKKWIILTVLSLTLVVLAIIFFKSGIREKIKPYEPETFPGVKLSPEEKAEAQKVTLFFLSDKDALLHPEEREIPMISSLVLAARRTVEELIQGSREDLVSPFPPQTQLREFFITDEGVAYVDFSKDFQEFHPSGSSAEMLTVYSVVNTLTYNFKSVKKVFILIEGRERDTLSGHIDLTRPLVPQYGMIAR